MGLNKKAVILLSGGLDSATVLFWAIKKGYHPQALIFDYGQRHSREVASARALCKKTGVPFRVISIKLPWQGSSLLDKKTTLPRAGSVKNIGLKIPSTYVPGRNTLFLSYGLSFAEATGAGAVMIGANALDYSGYPDCRPDFIEAMSKVFKLGTKAGRQGRPIKIVAPLLKLTKSQIIKLGINLGVPYELTWSCYRGGKRPCGTCDSCLLRNKGFDEAGVEDPALN
ncbi:MAG: 7-cyano-7-deazaguanine synthase QueC [Candidatus Edwardsbacteria bacterium RIFOXYD12_FULL_50_11]|uniref:7-cyano-7-deazaguanine synthase n=1 Tax=Candidatus Edwardsbacteria bacterium GWF2_54_11 TaxID=1817851 RepID=A0A1F5RDM1_9BACT|nr:MAG: 7-cyano-7-deazaguanine synthase QueC [Candidatus Edwardsbacteria bacterium RifOxyC12_full_54_24]OGF07641.1 MAG: 7-cyano-7-deazaguanine synthase QueC [Candidatus Edwardsbacteria bacterium RifOxyA12_full_54_48]OGF09892.1 MAG: 7-cyano-7-deazaguanine synthase QueC [Candidatus Edwardsbacteria bacterium GWE2_54_12]OGF12153.1 MAG: 7-cyano-7-deazaguanine synthase QueC [Candidatus Edwardsbacteria bacterium GWF2_54_11]OGF16253.1 MAG: 7-cyano-7-deazaguanine synthase QueC [Candidatus Edwardsbacteri